MTANQRAGTINVALPAGRVYPIPDATLDALDRKQIAYCYPFAPSAVSKTGSDTLSVTLTEGTTGLLAALSRADALSVTVQESASIAATLTASDTLGLTLQEQGTLLAILSRADTISVSIAEGYSLLVTTAVSDTLALTLGESSASGLLVAVQVSDAVVIGLGESASLLVTVVKAVTDTLGLSLTEVGAAELVAYARKICRWWMNHIPFVIQK